MKKKAVYISFRITEDEELKLNTMMQLMGYRNRSFFIRDQLFKKRVQKRNLSRSEANLSRQIAQYHADIKRIGINYNQSVRALNFMAKLTDKNGNPLVSQAAVDGKITDLYLLMEATLTSVLLLKSEVDAYVGNED